MKGTIDEEQDEILRLTDQGKDSGWTGTGLHQQIAENVYFFLSVKTPYNLSRM